MIKSPVDNISSTELLEEYDSSEVIALYQNDYGIDVTEYFPKNKFQLRQCSKTKYRFFYPETLEGKEQLYVELHNNRPSYYRFPKWEHQIAIKTIKKLNIDNLLEIGCATGDFISFLKVNTQIQTAGIELNKSAAEIGRNRGLCIYDEVIEEYLKKGLKYDLICSFQVLEHIYDINSFFSNSIKLLKKNAYIIFGVPHSNPYLYYFDRLHTLNLPPHHVGLWDKKTIQNIAEHFNLEVIDIQIEKPTTNELNEILRFWTTHAKKKYRLTAWICEGIRKAGRILKIEKELIKVMKKLFRGRNVIAILKKRE